MPIVSIQISDSNSTEKQKADLMKDITESFVKNLGKAPESVIILITELPAENIASGYRTLKQLRAEGTGK